MATSTCILILAFLFVGSLLMTGWHIITAILHVIFSIFHLFFQWHTLLIIVMALIVIWVLFFR